MEPVDNQTELNEPQAQQLLGTLSRNHDDICAAYLHQYRSSAQELSRADTLAEQQRIEQELQRLRQARGLLLGEPLAQTTAPVQAAAPAQAAGPQPQPQSTAQSITPQEITPKVSVTTAPVAGSDITAAKRFSSKPILISSTLVLLLCSLVLTASLYWSQLQQFEQLQVQLHQQQQTHNQLNQSHIALQQSFDQNLQRQSEERQQWAKISDQQHQQISQQLALIERQQNTSRDLQQQLAQVDKQLFIERQQTLKLGQQVARLDQQADLFIDELCADSAAIGPAVDARTLPNYMNRCRLLWSLAGE